jgi:phospholipid/cholesterol/gamma-HCH transport system substrate-binding protein
MGTTILKEGGVIQDTKSALVLEDLIGQFLYKSGDGKADPDATAAPAAPEGNTAPDANTAPQPAAH